MSSPPTSAQLVISSSPELPSMEDIIAKARKRPPLRSGSRAAPIPIDARTSFASAAEVLREAPEIDIETEKITKSPIRKPKPARRRGQKPQALTEEERPTLGRTESLGSLSPLEKPWQRYQSKSSSNSGSPSPSRLSTSARPRATSGRRTSDSEFKMDSDTVSKHFAKKPETVLAVPKVPARDSPPPITNVQPQPSVVARRRDWTPPPADTVILLDSESDGLEFLSSASKVLDAAPARKAVFDTLQVQYGCKSEASGVSKALQGPAEVLGKRKLIETVSMTGTGPRTSRSVSPTKPAPTRRKIRTITELATAPYAAPIEPEFDITIGHTRDSLLGYLDQGGNVKALFEVQKAALSKAKEGKKPAKAAPKKPRKKNGKVVEVPILLSPSTALKQSRNQDFVFGTSSQLILDDSPRTLRELQLAIQASNKLDIDANAADDQSGLWHAGARDVDGSLLEFRYISNTQEDQTRQSPSPQMRLSDHKTQEQEGVVEALPLETPKAQEQPSRESPPAPNIAEPACEKVSVQIQKSATPRKPTKPNYELLTDVQLAHKIKSFGFKAIKRRTAMVSLLDKCWESQHQATSPPGTQAMSTSAAAQLPKKATPTKVAKPDPPAKRPRGRPKKAVVDEAAGEAANEAVVPVPKPKTKPRSKSPAKTTRARKTQPKKPVPIEIPDSDDILEEQLSAAPSTPRDASSPEQVFSPMSPILLDMSTTDEADLSLALSPPTDNEEVLFTHITDIVKSAPRSTDPSEPSWHERMLLYDPIVLEDFAAWLNSGELTKVGYDAEVSPTDVKKWCESKSIICLWKQTSRGKERSRY
ncbi:DNA replication [Microdochium nivale]|nr:DNA replication [Microdochium nivale]